MLLYKLRTLLNATACGRERAYYATKYPIRKYPIRKALPYLSVTGLLVTSLILSSRNAYSVESIKSARHTQRYHFHSRSNTLSEALIKLGQKACVSIIIPENKLTQAPAPLIQGHLTLLEALEKLLSASQLSYRQIDDFTFVIEKKQAVYEDDGPIEEVSVIGITTGSRIARSTAIQSAPLDQISALDLERAGTQTLSDFLKFIPAVSGNSTSTAVQNGGDGTTKVTLRGLPANNTLVLLNGQRVSFDGLAGDSVDLNTIPPIIISGIDIYKDGASAIYGSEAIAGVVNINTHQTFSGLKLSQTAGISAQGDALSHSTDFMLGGDFEENAIVVALSHYAHKGLYSRDRELSASSDMRAQGGIDNRTSAGPYSWINLSDNQSLTLQDGVTSATPSASDFRPTSADDLYNYRIQTSSLSPSNRTSGYAHFLTKASDTLSWRSQFLASKTHSKIILGSSPLYTAFNDNPFTVSADNIYNPFGEDISDIRRRVLELDRRIQSNSATSIRVNTGFTKQGTYARWHGNVYWNQTKAVKTISNLLDGDKTTRALGPASNCQGLEIDGCEALNLFGPIGSITPEQLSFVQGQSRYNGESESRGINLNVAGEVFGISPITINYSFGLDLRNEKSVLSPVHHNKYFLGSATDAYTKGQRTVSEVYGELLIPLIENKPWAERLELELATRWSRYNDYGKNNSPKLALIYGLNDALTFRGTYSQAFRAPSIKELYKTGESDYSILADPCAIDNSTEIYAGCEQQSDPFLNQYLTFYRGATSLSPEKSKNHTVGLVYQSPITKALHFSIDFFDIRLRNVIDANPQTILDQNARNGLFSEFIERDNNGNISRLTAPFFNIGRRRVQGLDINFSYRFDNLKWSINASNLRKYRQQLSPTQETTELAGTFQDSAKKGNGSLPKWKANSGFTWFSGDSEINYSINYISHTREQVQFQDGDRTRKISPSITHNMQANHIFKNIELSFGVDNIFDKPPPFAASAFNDNYDARTYDIKGRYFYIKLGKSY